MIVDSVINGIFGVGTAALNNEYARQREQEARRENYTYGEMAANNADARTRALYGDLYSPQAQMQQIRDAGLSPSLFYGDMAGISGQSGAQGTGATGVNPNIFGLDPMALANIRLMDAQTEKLKEETKTEAGENEKGTAAIRQMLSDAGLKDALYAYNNSLKYGQDLANYITEETKEFSINQAFAISEKAASDAQKAVFETIAAANNAEFLDKTLQERIKQVSINNKLTSAETILRKMQTNYTESEITKNAAILDKWQQEVAQGWADVYTRALSTKNEQERNKIVDEYFDAKIELAYQELNLDREKLNREMKFKWSSFISTLINDNNHKFLDSLMQLIPSNALSKKPNPIGFR